MRSARIWMNWIRPRKTIANVERADGYTQIMPAPTITEIRPLPTDPNLRRVRVGTKTVATLRASDVEALRLRVGMPWTATLEESVRRTIASLKASRDAMRLLGRRQLSRAELIERLIRKGHEQHVVQTVVDEMSRAGWIDDAALAEALREELVRRKAAGVALIRAKLRARKIDPQLIEAISSDLATHGQGFDNALALARKRLGGLDDVPCATAARRVAATLARKGYDDDTIERVLETLHLVDDAGAEC